MKKADQNQGRIYLATKKCRKSFESCQSIPSLQEHRWAENRLAEFNAWAANNGATAHPLASLDMRLSVQPTARLFLAYLIRTLQNFVEQCKRLGRPKESSKYLGYENPMRPKTSTVPQDKLGTWIGSRTLISSQAASWFDSLEENLSDKDSSDGIDDDEDSSKGLSDNEDAPTVDPYTGRQYGVQITELSNAMHGTEYILEWLIRLGHDIRRTGTSSRLRRADKEFNEEHHQEHKRSLTLVIWKQKAPERRLEERLEMGAEGERLDWAEWLDKVYD
jgi:hypothetical protein